MGGSQPLDQQGLIDQGKQQYIDGNLEASLASYLAAGELGEDIRVDLSLFTLYSDLEEYSLAEESMRNAIAKNSGRGQHWIDLADFHHYKVGSEPSVVKGIFEEAIGATAGLGGTHVDVLTNYSRYLSEIKDYAGAVVQLEKAQNIDRDRADSFEEELVRLRKKAIEAGQM